MKTSVFLLLLFLVHCVVSGHHTHKKHHHKAGHHHNKQTHVPERTNESDDIKYVVIRETIALAGLILCFSGSRIIKVTFFIGGFAVLFVAAYITLPSLFDYEQCCGPHSNWMVRVGVCVLVGLIGGALSLFVYYVGIFAIGGVFGMICALVALSTPLAEKDFFDSAVGVGLFYGAFIIVGGLLALLLSTIAVAAASSLSGSYAVFYGVDYFAKTNFSGGIEVLLIQLQDYIRDEFGMGAPHRHHPNFLRTYTLKDILIFTLFIVLALMGFVFQLYLAKSDTKLKKIKEGGCKGAQCHCHAQYNKSSEYLLEYLKSLQNSKESLGTHKESLLLQPH